MTDLVPWLRTYALGNFLLLPSMAPGLFEVTPDPLPLDNLC